MGIRLVFNRTTQEKNNCWRSIIWKTTIIIFEESAGAPNNPK